MFFAKLIFIIKKVGIMKLLILFLSTFVIISFAYSQIYYMNVNLKDGTKIIYEIDNIKKIEFSDITSIDDTKKLHHVINSFKLLQNYPNPFNPSTTIEYQIPKSGHVKVSIFDLSGRLIKRILNQNQVKGSHKIHWNGESQIGEKVASGFYIYTVKFENSIYSKKMILLK